MGGLGFMLCFAHNSMSKNSLNAATAETNLCVASLMSLSRDDADEPVHTFSLYIPITAKHITKL